jgi:NAD(P)H-hydrate epimerase
VSRPLLVVTAAAMREADARAERAGISLARLMEAAGAAALRALEGRSGDPLGYRFAVVCGKGNNGGDGLVLARLLEARGARVEVGVAGRFDELAELPRAQLDAARAAGVPVREIAGPGAAAAWLAERRWDYVVDALLGTGARGAPSGTIAAAVEAIGRARETGAQVAALDLPTGLDADSSRPSPPCVEADLTVTFAALKRAHVLYPGRALCGTIEVADIGIPDEALDGLPDSLVLLTPEAAAKLLPVRPPAAHKGTAGRALLVGGAVGMSGAVALAAEAALRAGAGLVVAAVPESSQPAVAALGAETVTLGLPEVDGGFAAAAAPLLLERAAASRAVAFGPGLGRDGEIALFAKEFLRALDRPLVIDADGLEALARFGDWRSWVRGVPVLTPHLGEMSRLTGESAEALEARRLDVAAEWAARWNAVVLLKGAPTVIAAPDGRRTVNATGNPQMASAGMGDVLTGCVLAFLAQGLEGYDAARIAAYVHGHAADRIVARRGAAATLAGEVGREISEVIGELRGSTGVPPLPRHKLERESV